MFNLDGLQTPARIVSAHDGDTMRAVFVFAGSYSQFIVRVLHVDSPELASKDPLERDAGLRVRNRVLQMLCPDADFQLDGTYTVKQIESRLEAHPAIVTLKCGEWDKYGRLLAQVTTTQHLDVAQTLQREGLVHSYEGGTKNKWSFDSGVADD